jgi:hypothetical protein
MQSLSEPMYPCAQFPHEDLHGPYRPQHIARHCSTERPARRVGCEANAWSPFIACRRELTLERRPKIVALKILPLPSIIFCLHPRCCTQFYQGRTTLEAHNMDFMVSYEQTHSFDSSYGTFRNVLPQEWPNDFRIVEVKVFHFEDLLDVRPR